MTESMTGFSNVPFRILRLGNGPDTVQDFGRPAFANTIHVPGGNTNETFLLGRGVPVVTWQIELANATNYNLLDDAVQTTATLRVPHGISAADHTEAVYFGTTYDEIASVTLLSLSSPVMRIDGTIRCDATFQGDW